MSDSSEEKTLPPSAQKLRKAREKGSVVTARDALASAILAASLLYLYLRRASLAEDLTGLFILEPSPDLPFMAQLAEKARIALQLMVSILAPLFALVIALGILLGMAVTGGPLFSTHPLTPDFNKLNPVKGFKNIFGRRPLMTFLMHLLRVSALLTAMGALLWGSLFSMLHGPSCGLSCEIPAFERMILPVLIAALVVLLVFALLDYMVQRAEFRREQRMSVTEQKREYKDQEGDPHLRGQLASLRRAMVDRPTGLGQATLVVHDAPRGALAIRYVEGDTPAPLLVARAKGGEQVSRMLSRAKVRQVSDPALIDMLRRTALGEYITEDEAITLLVPHLQSAAQS